MKALSVLQPAATLLAHGLKRLDVRGWATAYRGPLVIHAAGRFPPPARLLCHQEPYRTLLAACGYRDWQELPTGRLLGVVELAGCTRVELLDEVPELERQLGEFRPGQWAWQLANACSWPAPLPWRGRLGVFDLPETAVPGRCA